MADERTTADDSVTDDSVADRVEDSIEGGSPDRIRAELADLEGAPVDVRKEGMRRLCAVAEDRPSQFDGVAPALGPFLTDEERPVRLTTAKLFVAVAESEPGAVVPVVEALAARLADEDEFYYVRARSAEALGFVALEHPDEVASPEVLADLRIGLAFDEPEVTEKLAKALEFVALGDPGRLAHLVGRLATHLDDEHELVRYHLCTALVAVGTASPGKLTDATEPLVARFEDPSPYVRARAAEALCLLVDAGHEVSVPTDAVAELATHEEAFVAERGRALLSRVDPDDVDAAETGPKRPEPANATESADPIGSVASVRKTTTAVVEELTTPEPDGECPHCGLELPAEGPPVCPRCGAPR